MPRGNDIHRWMVAPLFENSYLLIVGPLKHLTKSVKKLKLDPDSIPFTENDNGVWVLRNPETGVPLFILYLGEPESPGIVSHECYHLACRIFNEHAVPTTEDTEEVFALLLDHLVDEVSEALE